MKDSNDTIGNRTRDLPACRAVPQPSAPHNDGNYKRQLIRTEGLLSLHPVPYGTPFAEQVRPVCHLLPAKLLTSTRTVHLLVHKTAYTNASSCRNHTVSTLIKKVAWVSFHVTFGCSLAQQARGPAATYCIALQRPRNRTVSCTRYTTARSNTACNANER
jgi:hypothetical protein